MTQKEYEALKELMLTARKLREKLTLAYRAYQQWFGKMERFPNSEPTRKIFEDKKKRYQELNKEFADLRLPDIAEATGKPDPELEQWLDGKHDTNPATQNKLHYSQRTHY